MQLLIGRTERSTTAMSPGKSPAPIMLSPAMPHGEGGGRIHDQQLVEIERAVEIVLGRRREAALDGDAGERHRDAAPPVCTSRNPLMSPARSVPCARRRARAATGSGRRITAVGAPRGRPPTPLRLRVSNQAVNCLRGIEFL